MPFKRRRNSPKRLTPASSSRRIKSFHFPPITPRVVSAGQRVVFLPRAILTLRLDHYFKVRTLQDQRRGYTVSNVKRKRIRKRTAQRQSQFHLTELDSQHGVVELWSVGVLRRRPP